jgi:hypothetical protein
MIDYLILAFALIAALTGILRVIKNERLWRYYKKHDD